MSERPTHPVKRHSRGPSISIELVDQGDMPSPSLLSPSVAAHFPPLATPLTPNYTFGHDDHFSKHHESHHMPNLHPPSTHMPSHEGHSHNMRGVFLHVMAVSFPTVILDIEALVLCF